MIADDVIRELVDAEPQGRPLVVVSSDQEVVRDVTRSGARVVAVPRRRLARRMLDTPGKLSDDTPGSVS